MTEKDRSLKQFWEKNAESWTTLIETGSIASRSVTNQAILAEILRQNPRSLLDVGCGEGWLASQLSSRKIDYTGIDGSSNLIEIAKKRHPGNFEYLPYEKIKEWKPTGKFDCAVFNFSLLDDKISDLLKATHELLNENGTILIQTLHPFYTLNEYKDGWRNEDFKSVSVPFSGSMPWYGRTLESWTRLFKDCTLQVSEIIEPRASETPLSIIFVLA